MQQSVAHTSSNMSSPGCCTVLTARTRCLPRTCRNPPPPLSCRFIHSYSRSPAQTIGSVVCTNLASGSRHELVEVCTIHMSDMPDDVIDKLIDEGDVMWCAGGLMVEHPLVVPYITSIEGTQEAVMGLGKEAVMQVLVEAAGV